VSGTVYYRNPFGTLLAGKQLTEYVVMDVEVVKFKDLPDNASQGRTSSSHALADVWVVRASDLGATDQPTIHVRSHLGNLLKPGDTVHGLAICFVLNLKHFHDCSAFFRNILSPDSHIFI
jgi:nonsense-mediated mRNA decay protein 3